MNTQYCSRLICFHFSLHPFIVIVLLSLKAFIYFIGCFDTIWDNREVMTQTDNSEKRVRKFWQSIEDDSLKLRFHNQMTNGAIFLRINNVDNTLSDKEGDDVMLVVGWNQIKCFI